MFARAVFCGFFFCVGYVVFPLDESYETAVPVEPVSKTDNTGLVSSFPVRVGGCVRVIRPQSHLYKKTGKVVSVGVEPDRHLVEIDGVGYVIAYNDMDSVPSHIVEK